MVNVHVLRVPAVAVGVGVPPKLRLHLLHQLVPKRVHRRQRVVRQRRQPSVARRHGVHAAHAGPFGFQVFLGLGQHVHHFWGRLAVVRGRHTAGVGRVGSTVAPAAAPAAVHKGRHLWCRLSRRVPRQRVGRWGHVTAVAPPGRRKPHGGRPYIGARGRRRHRAVTKLVPDRRTAVLLRRKIHGRTRWAVPVVRLWSGVHGTRSAQRRADVPPGGRHEIHARDVPLLCARLKECRRLHRKRVETLPRRLLPFVRRRWRRRAVKRRR